MAHEKSEDKPAKKNKPLKTLPLKYQEQSADNAYYTLVPVLGHQIDVNTWQAREGILFEPEALSVGVKPVQAKHKNPIINLKLQDAIYEFNIQLRDAIGVLKQVLTGSVEADDIANSVQASFRSRPPEEKRCSFDPMRDSFEQRKFTTKDKQADTYPYICVTGFTYNYHLATIAYGGGLSKSSIDVGGCEPFYYKNGKAVYTLSNNDLAGFIKGRQKFIKAFVETAETLWSYKYEQTPTSYTDPLSAEEPVVAEYADVESSMAMFLVEVGIPWQYFSSQDIYSVLCKLCLREKLSPPLAGVLKEALNAPDRQGKTPLMYAVELEEHVLCAKMFLSHGAKFNVADNQGKRVLDYVICNVKKNKNPSWRALLNELLKSLKSESIKINVHPCVAETQSTLFSSSALQKKDSPPSQGHKVVIPKPPEDDSGSMSRSP